MNKYDELKKATITYGLIRAGIVGGFTALYVATSTYLSTTDTQKTEAERALSQDNGRIADLNSQLDKSNIAEKRFLETQGNRNNGNYSSNSDDLKEWIKNAINQYRLSNGFKLSLTPEKLADIKELNGTSYEALEHPAMKIEYSSITDMHSLSFMEDLQTNAPGFVVIDQFSMKRLADVDRNIVNLLQAGASPFLVETKITINWIGLRDKTEKKSDAPASSAAAPSQPMRGL